MLYSFKFGGPINEKLFFNRESEVSFLVNKMRLIEGGVAQNYALIGPRRVGKSSLLNIVKNKLKGGKIIPVFFDCESRELSSESPSPELLLKALGNKILEAYFENTNKEIKQKFASLITETKDAVINTLAEVLGTIKALEIKTPQHYLVLRLDLEKKSLHEKLSDKELFNLFEETFELAEKLALEKNVFFAIILDEFQETAKFTKPIEFIASFRRHMQAQKRVVYLLSGSNIGMLEKILLKERFGGHVPIMWLKPFTQETAEKFLLPRLPNANHDALLEILDFTKAYPAYLNWFGVECNEIPTQITLKEIKELENKFFSYEGLKHVFESDLTKASPRKGKILSTFIAMCVHDATSPSQIAKHLTRTSTVEVITYLKRLEERGMVRRIKEGEYVVVDLVLKNYVKYNHEHSISAI